MRKSSGSSIDASIRRTSADAKRPLASSFAFAAASASSVAGPPVTSPEIARTSLSGVVWLPWTKTSAMTGGVWADVAAAGASASHNAASAALIARAP